MWLWRSHRESRQSARPEMAGAVHRDWNADASPWTTEALECGYEQGGMALPPADWNGDAAVAQPLETGMRTKVPGPYRHWNADVSKEGWPCHRETGMRKLLECG
ncbi:hypothetical protein QAD02_004278 [Eretmocerus hayati]|uniref:Uncharacterized protein n=1 Tax=Eretmocerus hayati TaxID=131215 RepID=A0ACC2NRZ9_9HYME|nr:hypothetical protein QAD02_004278 [Eretmocerus hayati]